MSVRRDSGVREGYAAKSGAELRAKRESLGFTQAEMAEQLGVSKSALSTWERGASVMSALRYEQVRAWLRVKKQEQHARNEAIPIALTDCLPLLT